MDDIAARRAEHEFELERCAGYKKSEDAWEGNGKENVEQAVKRFVDLDIDDVYGLCDGDNAANSSVERVLPLGNGRRTLEDMDLPDTNCLTRDRSLVQVQHGPPDIFSP